MFASSPLIFFFFKQPGHHRVLPLSFRRQRQCCIRDRGEDVKFPGFALFMVGANRPRRGRNPKTGEEITITPRKVVTFRASHLMKMKMGGGDE